MRIAVCSGSFDPITLGHMDIIRRTAACFDQVYVCVSPNAEKRGQMFTPEQKLKLVEAAVLELPNVTAELYGGLLADFAAERKATAIVRGIRTQSDFDTEYQQAMVNSTVAREMIHYHQPLDKYLPKAILPLIRDWTEQR